MSAPFVRFDQHFIRDDIELFLCLSLDIVCSHRVANSGERTLADRMTDCFACTRDDFDEQSQLGRNAAVIALLLDEILGECDPMHGMFSDGALACGIMRLPPPVCISWC
ncbi:hypothetical protein D3C83_49840 [compost metagenome]